LIEVNLGDVHLSFSTLTLFYGQQEGRPAVKITTTSISKECVLGDWSNVD